MARDRIQSEQVMARLTETVRRFDGFVAKYTGEGVLVYFGHPHAHEDDAEQTKEAGTVPLSPRDSKSDLAEAIEGFAVRGKSI